jgi:hypothetical protein
MGHKFDLYSEPEIRSFRIMREQVFHRANYWRVPVSLSAIPSYHI